MSQTPVQHCGGTIYSVRGRTRMARVDLGQPGAPLLWAVPQLSPWSFTEATWHVSFLAPVELVCVSVFARCHNTQASNSIHINSITMPMHDVLLRHFRKMPFMVSICGCTLLSLIRCHSSDVYLGMCPIKMATPILMYYGASAKLAKRRRRRTIEGYG